MSKEATLNLVKDLGLTFHECDSRLNYGMIGKLNKDDFTITIFESSFYVISPAIMVSIPFNERLLGLIKSIQHHFKDLS